MSEINYSWLTDYVKATLQDLYLFWQPKKNLTRNEIVQFLASRGIDKTRIYASILPLLCNASEVSYNAQFDVYTLLNEDEICAELDQASKSNKFYTKIPTFRLIPATFEEIKGTTYWRPCVAVFRDKYLEHIEYLKKTWWAEEIAEEEQKKAEKGKTQEQMQSFFEKYGVVKEGR